MTAAAYAASGTLSSGSGTSFGVAVPSGVVNGSLVLVGFYLDGITLNVNSLPSGFAAAPGIPIKPSSPMNHQLHLYAKLATGSDAGTYTFGLSGSGFAEWQAHRFTPGRVSGSLWDTNSGTGAAQAFDSASASATPAVSMTTQEGDELVIHAATCWAGGTWTPPSGFTKIMGSGIGLMTMAYKLQAAAGATGSVSATASTSDKREAWVGGLLPSAPVVVGNRQFLEFFG